MLWSTKILNNRLKSSCDRDQDFDPLPSKLLMRVSSFVLLSGSSVVLAANNLSCPLNTSLYSRCSVDSIETVEQLRYCLKSLFENTHPDELVFLLKELHNKLSNRTIMVCSEALELAYTQENYMLFLRLLTLDPSSELGPTDVYMIRALLDGKNMLVKKLLNIGSYEPSQLLRYATSNHVGTALILIKFKGQISFNHQYLCFKQMIIEDVPFACQLFAPAIRSDPNR